MSEHSSLIFPPCKLRYCNLYIIIFLYFLVASGSIKSKHLTILETVAPRSLNITISSIKGSPFVRMFEAKNNDPCLVFHGSEEVLRPTPTLYMSWLLWQRNSKNIIYFVAALKELCQVQPMSRAFECGFNDFAKNDLNFREITQTF